MYNAKAAESFPPLSVKIWCSFIGANPFYSFPNLGKVGMGKLCICFIITAYSLSKTNITTFLHLNYSLLCSVVALAKILCECTNLVVIDTSELVILHLVWNVKLLAGCISTCVAQKKTFRNERFGIFFINSSCV